LFSAPRTAATGDLGWAHDVPATLFPLPGGFVGGDLVAFLYGCDAALRTSHAARLYLDLGTNGEIALAAGERIYATAAAAGPAFEGGNLTCGMAAQEGAISGVALAEGRVRLTTIGNGRPCGICGSGVLEAVAELLTNGVLDRTGRLLSPVEIPSNLANRVEEIGGEPAFIFYRDARGAVYLTQGDIRQVQLAKAAVRSGVEVLCERAGIAAAQIAAVALTGSFGARLTAESLKMNGILTQNMVKVTGFVEEGALRGTERALTAPRGMAEVTALAAGIRVVPLSGTPLFEKHFFAQMDFPA
ncbi:MAG TPA: ASKHA domain-containing protein, partial [Geobacteraceae bacterium]